MASEKRSQKTIREFLVNGEWVNRLSNDGVPTAIRMTDASVEDGESLEYQMDVFSQDNILRGAAWAFLTVSGNELSSGGFDAVAARLELLAAGQWSEGRSGGARISILAEAVCRALAERGDERDFEATKAALLAKSESERKTLRNDPVVAVHYANIQAERAAERAKAAKAAAKGVKSSALDSF